MKDELAKTIDAAAFAAADLVTPIRVVRAAGAYLLTELSETDRRRWEVTQALGSLAAAQKSIEEAAEALMRVVPTNGDIINVDIDPATIRPWQRPTPVCADPDCSLDAGHSGEHYADGEWIQGEVPF